jgi:hypothetical protein
VTGEIDIGGVFLPALLVWAVVALGLGAILRRVLTWIGAYRLVWHPALFDMAVFVVLVGVVAALAGRYHGFGLLG